MRISVTHPDLTMLRISVNGQIIEPEVSACDYSFDVSKKSDIEIFFEPWKIKPLIRLNNHLVDYWLADIFQYDHMVKFHWDHTFYQQYQKRIVDSKIQYLGLTRKEDIDYYLGINNDNLDIVEKIKSYLT